MTKVLYIILYVFYILVAFIDSLVRSYIIAYSQRYFDTRLLAVYVCVLFFVYTVIIGLLWHLLHRLTKTFLCIFYFIALFFSLLISLINILLNSTISPPFVVLFSTNIVNLFYCIFRKNTL